MRMVKDKILVTFITVVFNNKKGLKKTLDSTYTFVKKYNFIEHVIIDAKSSDGSTEMALEYASKLSNCKIIIEKDKGIYDALNKGTKNAAGALLMLMHSGDILEESGFTKFLNDQFVDTDKIHAFNYSIEDDTEVRLFRRNKIGRFSTDIKHPSLLIPKEHLEVIEGYPLKFNVSADVYAVHKIISSIFMSDYDRAIVYHDYSVIIMEPFGFSAEIENFGRKKIEHIKIFHQLEGWSLRLVRLTILNVLRILKVKIFY
jgi:glycosyltransferase involved in cell wall biosynthesis